MKTTMSLDSPLVTPSNWKERCREITERELWNDVMASVQKKRMGFADGPGAVLLSKPYAVTKKIATRHVAHFVVQDAAGNPHYYRWKKPITYAEFQALCRIIIPGTGPCEWDRLRVDRAPDWKF